MEFDAAGVDISSWVGVLGTIIGVVTWFIKQASQRRADQASYDEKLEKRFNELHQKYTDLRFETATTYHSKSALDDIFDMKLKPVFDMLTDIKERLRAKEGRGHARES